jgi:hypothetical protein
LIVFVYFKSQRRAEEIDEVAADSEEEIQAQQDGKKMKKSSTKEVSFSLILAIIFLVFILI